LSRRSLWRSRIKPKAPVFARQGSKNLLKNDPFLAISTQKARIFANFLPLFTHFYQFLTKFFLPILPKPHNFILSVFILSFVEVVEGLTPPPLFFTQKQRFPPKTHRKNPQFS